METGATQGRTVAEICIKSIKLSCKYILRRKWQFIHICFVDGLIQKWAPDATEGVTVAGKWI
jgi:hypothetical protein